LENASTECNCNSSREKSVWNQWNDTESQGKPLLRKVEENGLVKMTRKFSAYIDL
jgi:hypothetical protein